MSKKTGIANKQYSISDLSKQFDVTSRALRLYEESGLLAPVREGSRRIYSERDRVRLRLILRGKRLGCSLAEIREIFDIYDTETGQKDQLVFFLQTLDNRLKTLELQKQDVENALEDVIKIRKNAQEALDQILLDEKKSKGKQAKKGK